MKKHTALKQNIKNDTCIEFRRDIKALTLLADTTSSGNLFHSWTTRTEKKNFDEQYLWNPHNTVSYCFIKFWSTQLDQPLNVLIPAVTGKVRQSISCMLNTSCKAAAVEPTWAYRDCHCVRWDTTLSPPTLTQKMLTENFSVRHQCIIICQKYIVLSTQTMILTSFCKIHALHYPVVQNY